MGGELLASRNGGEQSPPLMYKDIFYEALPYYLHIGMSEAQFWNGDCSLAKTYRKVYDLKKQERNQELWLQGLYIYNAMANLAPMFRDLVKNPKPLPYPDKPFPLDSKGIEDRKEEEHQEAKVAQKNKLMEWAKAVNAKKGAENDRTG